MNTAQIHNIKRIEQRSRILTMDDKSLVYVLEITSTDTKRHQTSISFFSDEKIKLEKA